MIPVRQKYLVIDVDPDWEVDVSKPGVILRDMNFALAGGSHLIVAVGTNKSFEELVDGFNRFAPAHLKVG